MLPGRMISMQPPERELGDAQSHPLQVGNLGEIV